MMNLAVAEAVYIRPALSPPLWYEIRPSGTRWVLFGTRSVSALGTRYGTRWYEISPCGTRWVFCLYEIRLYYFDCFYMVLRPSLGDEIDRFRHIEALIGHHV